MRLLACDPGANPGFAVFEDGRCVLVTHRPEAVSGRFDEAVFEAQHAAATLFRGGRRVRIGRKSQMTLSFTAGRLFERFTAARKFRILPDDWRRVLWPGSSRLRKEVVLARLDPAWGSRVAHVPKTHRGDCLEAVGIGQAWMRLTEEQKAEYVA